MTNSCFPGFPSLREQDALHLEWRINALKEKLACYSLEALRNMTDAQFDGSGLHDAGLYIQELRTSRDLWKDIAVDRAKQMYTTRAEVTREVVKKLMSDFQKQLADLE